MNIALFPGSFDPITVAHTDILRRALPLFDKVIVAIGLNNNKQSYFDFEVRRKMLEATFKDNPKIEVQTYNGLTVDFCHEVGAKFMIRGIRSVSDFEYEKAIAQMNNAMQPNIESIFILSRPGYSAISSTIVRDIIRNSGKVEQFVPKEIIPFLIQNSQ